MSDILLSMDERVDLRPVLLARIQRFHKRLLSVRYSASTESVHEFRIACRELLACAPLLHSLGPTRPWRRRLRKAIKALNRLRDLQQMQDRLLADQLSILRVENKIRRALHHWQRYQPELHRNFFSSALKASVKCLEQVDAEKSRLMLGVWQREWQTALVAVQQRLAVADATDLKTLHRLRIRYKNFRYLLELMLEAGLPLSLDPSALKYWQTLLGDVEDYRVMAKWVLKLGGSEELHEQFANQARKNALAFIQKKDEFSNFIKTIDQQIAGNAGWSDLC